MRHRYQIVAVGILVTILAATVFLRFGPPAHAAHAHTVLSHSSAHGVAPGIASTDCTLSPWRIVPSPNVGTSALNATAAVSSRDVWAVGTQQTGIARQTLIEHWNGAMWSVVSSPNDGSGDNFLEGVAALAANDVWAVGFSDNSGTTLTLIEHWDGSQWSIVPSPNPPNSQINGVLYSISADAANDVWAVGTYTVFSSNTFWNDTLVEHWDGTQWSIVTSTNPSAGNNNVFIGVAAISADDVWTVGYDDSNSSSSSRSILLEHWNGTSWSVVSSSVLGMLWAVAASSSTNVWTVGSYFNSTAQENQSLTMHWNGSAWSIVPSPNPSGPNITTTLYAIAAAAPDDVWAVGNAANELNDDTITEHWNGTQWSIVPSQNVGGSTHNHLYGVAAIAATDVWAVGSFSTSTSVNTNTLAEHYRSVLPRLPSTASRTASHSPGGAILCP